MKRNALVTSRSGSYDDAQAKMTPKNNRIADMMYPMISVADMSLHTIPVDDSHSVFYESTVTLALGQLYK